MRKINYLFVALMTMLLVASCSQDDTLSVDTNSNEAMVSFNLELPDTGPQSRAIGDGKTVNQLVYAVYYGDDVLTGLANAVSTGDNIGQFVDDAFNGTNKHTINLSLLKGKTYQIAFWAQNKEGNHYNTEDLTKVEVTYGGENNDESRDAFFGVKEFTVAADASIDVVLNRPFAQINVGVTADDFDNADKAGLTVSHSSVVIKNAAKNINLLDGSVNETEDVTYTIAAIPGGTLKANEEKYTHLSMSYILVSEEKSTLEDLTYVFSDGNGESVELSQGLTSVPVQRNYRTNIVGKLLTNDIKFDITISEIFNEPANNVMVVKNNTELAAALADNKVQNIVLKGEFDGFIVNRDVTITGGTINTVIVAGEPNPVGIYITNDAKLNIDGVKFNGNGHASSYGLLTWHSKTPVVNVTNSEFVNIAGGVYFNPGASGSITNNKFITSAFGVGADTDQEVEIKENSFTFSGKAIELFDGASANGVVINDDSQDVGSLNNFSVERNTFLKSETLDIVGLVKLTDSNGNVLYAVSTIEALAKAIEFVEKSDVEIKITSNLEGAGWASYTVDGYKGSGIITIDGDFHTITGLTTPLIQGTWAGKSGVNIKNLTIDKADMSISTEWGVGGGAFISWPQASEQITLENCHLINSTINGGYWTGGLIGYANGYSGKDGPVFENIDITDCSVVNNTITGVGSVGGIIGHAMGDSWTKITINNAVIEGNTITSTGDSTIKAGIVMGTVGAGGTPKTVNDVEKTGGAYVNNLTHNDNNVTSNGEVIDRIYGRLGTTGGKLWVDGIDLGLTVD